MKILSSRYTQIGLALIVAVLLIASFSSSAAASGPVYHTVQKGQTLYSIAMHYGTSVWAIACANGLYNPNYVYAGQVLAIPYGGHDGCKPAQKDGYGKHGGGYDDGGYGHKDGYGNDGGYDDGYGHKDGYGDECGCEEDYGHKDGYGKDGGYDDGYGHKDGYGKDGGYDEGYGHDDGYGKDGGYDRKPEWNDKGDYGKGKGEKWEPYPHKKFDCYYTVRWGDHLYRIGLKYGVSWTVLAHANGLTNGNYIYAGQVLRVPCAW
jgi:LysM repeat protein